MSQTTAQRLFALVALASFAFGLFDWLIWQRWFFGLQPRQMMSLSGLLVGAVAIWALVSQKFEQKAGAGEQ